MTQQDNGTATVKEDKMCLLMILIRAKPTVTESINTNNLFAYQVMWAKHEESFITEVPAPEDWINSEIYICYSVTVRAILLCNAIN